MNLFEKAFNALVAVLGYIWRVEPVPKVTAQREAAYRQMLDDTLDYLALKTLTAPDNCERVRIVQNGNNYGAVVDFHDPKSGWSPEVLLGGGIIYESPAIAEDVAHASLGWLKSEKDESFQTKTNLS